MEDPTPREAVPAEPTDRADPPVYLPGTPTGSFTRTIERYVEALLR